MGRYIYHIISNQMFSLVKDNLRKAFCAWKLFTISQNGDNSFQRFLHITYRGVSDIFSKGDSGLKNMTNCKVQMALRHCYVETVINNSVHIAFLKWKWVAHWNGKSKR